MIKVLINSHPIRQVEKSGSIHWKFSGYSFRARLENPGGKTHCLLYFTLQPSCLPKAQ